MRILEDLFLNSLAEIYYAENQLLQSLSKLARANRDAESGEELESLLEQTELYVKEVERVFVEFSQKARAENCHPIADYLGQSNKMVSESKGLRTIDTALVVGEQKVENHEVAPCGSLQNMALQIGQNAAVNEHRDDDINGSKEVESESNNTRTGSATCYLWRTRYPTWRPVGKPIHRRFSSMHLTGTNI